MWSNSAGLEILLRLIVDCRQVRPWSQRSGCEIQGRARS